MSVTDPKYAGKGWSENSERFLRTMRRKKTPGNIVPEQFSKFYRTTTLKNYF